MSPSAALRLEPRVDTSYSRVSDAEGYMAARSIARARSAEVNISRGLLSTIADMRPLKPTADLQIRETSTPAVFLPAQEWEGYVEEVEGERFRALLIDVKDPRGARKSVDLQFSDVSKDDRELIELGAVFRWAIGYYDYAGSRNRMTKLVFRRLPSLSREMALASENVASSIKASLRFE